MSSSKASSKIALFSVSACLFGPLMFGLSLGFTGPAIDTMKDTAKVDGKPVYINPHSNLYVFHSSGDASTFSSIVTIGAMVGALLGGPLNERIGRKWAMIGMSPIFVATWVWMALANTSAQMQIARIIGGMAVGVCSFVAPTYIGEVSPIHLRGALGACNQLAITIGIMLSYLIGLGLRTSANTPGVSDSAFCDWRVLCWILVAPSALLGICMFFVPESPRWYASKGRRDEAVASLKLLRGGYPEEEELAAIEEQTRVALATIDGHGRLVWSDFTSCKLQLFIGLMLQVLQQFSGINAVMFYQNSIFQWSGITDSNLFGFLVMLEQVVVTFFAAALMDRAGRRVLFILGCVGMCVMAALMGYFFTECHAPPNMTDPNDLDCSQAPSWVAVMSCFLYVFFFSIGVGAIPWLILAEIFPNNVRGIAASLATVTNWLGAFLVTMFLSDAIVDTSAQAVFFFFAIICILAAAFCFVMVPETKGKTFEEIKFYFDKKQGYVVKDNQGPTTATTVAA